MAPGLDLATVGHGTVALDVFVDYLRVAEIRRLVDVRRFPSSRRNPQFAAASLEAALAAAGIAYAQAGDLGGRRPPAKDSRNAGLRNPGFRGYADWMRSDAFRAAFAALLAVATEDRTVVMCAETPWWRCHRRLIADAAVLLAGARIAHLLSGRIVPHRLTSGVVVDRTGRLVYPPPADLV